MDNKSSWSCTFELEDIEIIDHKKENEEKSEKWSCNQCSLFFLEKGKLDEHKKKHSAQEIVKCKYCNKALSKSDGNSECYENRKCETCEYKCSKCPQRFLRHSSLINHEKKHSSPKKKRAVSCNKKVNGIGPENVAVSKGIKRKWQETDDLEEQPTKGLKTKRSLNMKNSPKKKINVMVKTQGDSLGGGERSPIKTTKRLSLKASKSAEEKNNCENAPVKVTKRLSLKTKSILEDQNSVGFEHKQNAPTSNLLAVSQTSNMSSNENVVNYKPFSCHVCGDTFASDSALLNHIRTHGESAAKCFKCKFCNDEFDDIYKMQYHLAICPLAEDELEYSLSQSVPTVLPIKYSGGTLSPRKRGRPKKSVESTLTREKNEDEWTSSSSKKRNFRKRKSEMLENNLTAGNFTTSSLPKKPKRIPNKESLGGPDNNRVSEENRSEPLAGDIPELTRENEPDDDRKKLHQCPFPRCDFKFTREKALLCHMRNHSDDFDDSLKCHKCDIPFDDIQTLRLHIDTCKGIKEERDDDFNEEFETEGHDSSPLRTFQRMRKDFVCSRCGKSYQSQEKRNRCTHDDLQKEGSLVCRICSVKTEDEKKLKKHFKHNHLKSLPYQCPTCKAEFDSFSAENEHRMIHVEKGNQFTCLICTAKFLTYKDLYFHYSKDHVEQSQSICTICNITFPNDMALEEHNYVKHQSYDRFKCIFCHKAFTNSVSLTVHMKGHTTKFYKCKICYRPFKEAATLFQHMLFHASSFGTEKPLKCAICLASYAKQSRLKYHISRHIAKNSFSCQCLICGETMLDDESLINHIFDHSISITENNMTEKEIEWVEGVKQRKLVVKRGRRRLSSNLDYKCKPNIKIEKDDPEYKPCIKIEKVSRENEASPPLRQGRGRPRKIKVESHETPGPKQGRGRPRKQPQNDDTTMETKPVVQTHEDIIQEKNLYRLDNTRKSSRLVEKNSSGEYNMCKEIKKEKEDKDIVKRAKLIKQNDSKCTALTTKTFTATSKISSTKVNKAEEEIYLVSTKSRSTLRRNSLKEEKPLKNNDKHFYDSNCEILGENSCLSNKESNNVNKSINKPLQNGGVGPEIITISKVSRGGNKNEAISHNNWSSPIKIPENSDTIETKVRPMSFKMFSSLTNTRTPKPLNKKLMSDKLSEGKMQDEKSNSVDQMFSSLTNTRTPKPLNKELMNGKHSEGKIQDEKSNSVDQMFSSLTNTRTPKPLNKELMNGKLSQGKMQDEKSNSVGQMFSSLTNTRTPKPLNMEITNGKLCEGKMQDEKSNFVDPDSLEFKEDMFDDAEEDPLGGIEIPYISPRKGLRCNSRVIKGILDLNGPVSTMKNEKTLSHAETNKDEGGESKNPIDFIKESKYFEPSRGLTKYSCTTCLLSFSSQEELLFHNTTHIL